MSVYAAAEDNRSEQLLALVEQLLDELHPTKFRRQPVTLDCALDHDLGLDSLGRVELITRLEQAFSVSLPQSVFTNADTPRDLLRALRSVKARATGMMRKSARPAKQNQISDYPVQATHLLEVLEWHVEQNPQRIHIRVLEEDDRAVTITYRELWEGAQMLARGLQALGVLPGDVIAIMLPTGRDYFFSFMGILMAGGIPVPIYPPVRRSQLEEHLQRHSRILQNCQTCYLITVPEAKLVGGLLKSRVESLRNILTIADLKSHGVGYSRPVIGSQDIAFLQYTSGSTGNPKGVVLTHANLLANIRIMGEVVGAGANDVFVSWLPLYHDMGLIGAWLGSMYYAMEFVVMSPIAFITKPQRWLWAIHQYGGTLSAAPNFGYELCLKRIQDEDIRDLNLRSWRLAFNGAEQVSPETIKRFTERFAPYGFASKVMQPVYGLAESSVGLAFSDTDSPPLIDCVKRSEFSISGKAVPAEADDDSALCFVTCGQPLPGHQIRIVGEDGRELPERQEGFLQFQGPSVTSGYYRNPTATSQLFRGEWLDSGDMAYSAHGNIYITGRRKDIIIRAGRNIYPHELEEAVGNLPGIRKGCVAAFGSSDRRTASERLIILAEARELDASTSQALEEQINRAATDLLGAPADEVVLVKPHTVLKTSSGKIRRSACRDLYEQGQLTGASHSLWLQISRLAVGSVKPALRRLRKILLAWGFATYAWLLFGLLGSIAFISVVVMPSLTLRWAIVRGLLRFLTFATGIHIDTRGQENLPPRTTPCVYVANHASYIDALVLIAALPRNFSFVAKIELSRQHFLRLFLRRMQVEFVDRFDRRQAIMDTKRLTDKAQQKVSLLFFAEGTFTRIPGLREFYLGAFLTAAQAGVAVVPIALRGTRSILRSGSWFPHFGRVLLTVSKPIDSRDLPVAGEHELWQTAVALRNTAHAEIARHCGEPVLREQSMSK